VGRPTHLRDELVTQQLCKLARALYLGGTFRFSMATWTFRAGFFLAGARFFVSWSRPVLAYYSL
jgi:hypothetical protein